jgi:hypothetical protein
MKYLIQIGFSPRAVDNSDALLNPECSRGLLLLEGGLSSVGINESQPVRLRVISLIDLKLISVRLRKV